MSIHLTRPHTVYVPIKGGLPPLRDYLRRTWGHREFVLELARSTLRANNAATALGQAWQILNPILMATVYYLVWGLLLGRTGKAELNSYTIFTESYLTYLVGCIFVFNFMARSMLSGAKSIVNAGGLLFNSNFPRIVFPIASVMTHLADLLSMLVVYLAFHLLTGFPLQWTMLLLPWLLFVMVVFTLGTVMFWSTLTVYYRDVSNILPHVVRVLFFLSPVLWVPEEATSKGLPPWVMSLNPIANFLRFWNDMTNGIVPSATTVLIGLAWALISVGVGGAFFLRNEHDFAVRI